MPNNGKPGVMIYFETAKAIKALDYETKGRLFEAIMEYAEDGVIPAFDGVLAAVWPFVADKIERDSVAYDNKVNQKKRAAYVKWWKRYAEENGIDPDDRETRERWIDAQMDADATKSNAEDAHASSAMQKMPTGTVAGTGTPAPAVTGTVAGNAERVGKPTPTRHKYGEYANVLLTDEELAKLKAEFPRDWESRIDRLSEYIASTGKAYKSHLATIRAWAKKDKDEERHAVKFGNLTDGITIDDYKNDVEHPW
jgi:hypothetical protein